MKSFSKNINDKFLKIADAVSFGMGTPTNIIFWILAFLIWVFLGITRRELFVDGGFLPDWFTSNSWNFPLNTVTTVTELYIGFLVAAAANRSERRLREHIEGMKDTIENVKRINSNQDKILELLVRYQKREITTENKIYKELVEQKKNLS